MRITAALQSVQMGTHEMTHHRPASRGLISDLTPPSEEEEEHGDLRHSMSLTDPIPLTLYSLAPLEWVDGGLDDLPAAKSAGVDRD